MSTEQSTVIHFTDATHAIEYASNHPEPVYLYGNTSGLIATHCRKTIKEMLLLEIFHPIESLNNE